MNSESPGTGSSSNASGGANSNSSGSISNEHKSKPSLNALISEQNLSGPDTLKFDEAQEKTSTKTYGEQLGSGLNSPAQSPRLTSPVGSPSVSKRPPSSEGVKSTSKRLSVGQLDKKLQKLNTSTAAVPPPSKPLSGSKFKKGASKKLILPQSGLSSNKETSAGRSASSQISTPDEVAYLGSLFDQPEHGRDSVFSSSSSSQDSSKGLSQERKSVSEKDNGKRSAVEKTGRPSSPGDGRKEAAVLTAPSKTARLPSDKEESKVTSSKKTLPQSTLPPQPKEKGRGKQGKGGPSQVHRAVELSSSAGLVRPKLVGVCVQTDPPLTTEKWVMTDPQAPVESYKERYDLAMRDKKDLKVANSYRSVFVRNVEYVLSAHPRIYRPLPSSASASCKRYVYACSIHPPKHIYNSAMCKYSLLFPSMHEHLLQ